MSWDWRAWPWSPCEGCQRRKRQADYGKRVLDHLRQGGTARRGDFVELKMVVETERGAFLQDASAEAGEKVKIGGGFFPEREVPKDQPVHFDFEELGTLFITKQEVPKR